jgi:hypothetical protein
MTDTKFKNEGFKYPHTAKDGKWMVAIEIVSPKDQAMMGGTQFLFDSYQECVNFTLFLSGPEGHRIREEAAKWMKRG